MRFILKSIIAEAAQRASGEWNVAAIQISQLRRALDQVGAPLEIFRLKDGRFTLYQIGNALKLERGCIPKRPVTL